MNTCSTCKHWKDIDKFIEDIKRYGKDDEIPQSSKECEAVGNEYSQNNLEIAWICETEVYLISERSTQPFLLTSPDFGCTLWESKDVL